MHVPIIALLCLCLTSSVSAQETPVPASPTPVVATPLSTMTLAAKVVQIVLNDEHRQGVDWEAIVSDFHHLELKKDGTTSVDKKYKLSVGEVSDDDYAVLLEALDTVGHVTQTDFPTWLLTKDEHRTSNLTPDAENLPSIHLDLLWFSSPSGEPRLRIEPVIGVSNGQNPPLILKDKTDLGLKDNQTIIIGGLMKEEEITKMHKFPLLGNLPIVGLVFRKQGRLMQQTETIVFLTIHLNPSPSPEEPK
jgi:hypothetical protein